MVIRSTSWAEKAGKLSEWHQWFAVRPVRVPDVGIVWMETIERKGTWHPFAGMYNPTPHWDWEYRGLTGDAQ